ncbi:MAG: 3TM-type holin [Kiloniellales bacterium]
MLQLLAGPLAQLASTLIDKLFVTEEEKAAARARLLKLHQDGKLSELQISMSAIVEEARSADPWTSRARPTFLYLIYGVIALCFLGGTLGLWWPGEVAQAAANIEALLGAVPDDLWWLFGTGYLGYTGARSFDKWRAKKDA